MATAYNMVPVEFTCPTCGVVLFIPGGSPFENIAAEHAATHLTPTTDVEIANEGSIFMVWPLTDDARAWLDENVGSDATWFGARLVVEHRYIADLVAGMQANGLTVR